MFSVVLPLIFVGPMPENIMVALTISVKKAFHDLQYFLVSFNNSPLSLICSLQSKRG